MMWKYIRPSIIIVALLLLCACKKSPNLAHRLPGDTNENDDKVVSVAYLKSLYKGGITFIDEDIYIDVDFSSQWVSCNFHDVIVVEDHTGGIAISVEGVPKFSDENADGNICRISCYSLCLYTYGGMLHMGMSNYTSGGIEVIPIPETHSPLFFSKVTREKQFYMERKVWSFKEIDPTLIHRLVYATHVRFAEEEHGLEISPMDEDTDRHLIDRYGDTLILRSSRRCWYSQIITDKEFAIDGIITYFNGKYQISFPSSTLGISYTVPDYQ